MKLALLLPGYLDSPDYLHLTMFDKRLQQLGYTVERLDACHLWETSKVENYTITNFIEQIRGRVEFYKDQQPEEVVLLGHSMGGFTAIVAGNRIPAVTKIIALCPPPDRYGSVSKWGGTAVRVSKRDLPDNPDQTREFAIPFSYVEDGLQYSAVEDAKLIEKPLMIFIALDDVVVAPELTERIVAVARSPHVVRQPGIGHDFRRSPEQCEVVWREIEGFLKS